MPLPDKGHLTRPSRKRSDGWLPDESPRFGPLLVDKWHLAAQPDDDKPRASATSRFRHSDAGACSRAIAYAALDLPSRPMDAAGHMITTMGNIIHEAAQEAVLAAFVGEAEAKVILAGGKTSGHEDLSVIAKRDEDDTSAIHSIEIKSVDGYAYKAAIGERGPAQGPKHNHIIQGALNARAQDADALVILYVSRGAVSLQAAKRAGLDEYGRVVAEWTMPREVYEPIADEEIARVEAILGLVDDGVLPKRRVPDPELPLNHIIVDPKTGHWTSQNQKGELENTGTYWGCPYCRYQDICVATPPMRAKISEVPVLVELLEQK